MSTVRSGHCSLSLITSRLTSTFCPSVRVNRSAVSFEYFNFPTIFLAIFLPASSLVPRICRRYCSSWTRAIIVKVTSTSSTLPFPTSIAEKCYVVYRRRSMPTFIFLLLSMIGVNPFLYTVNSDGQIVPIERTLNHSSMVAGNRGVVR